MKELALSVCLAPAALAQLVPATTQNLGGGCVPSSGTLASAGYSNAPPTILVPPSGGSGLFIASGIHNFAAGQPALQIGFASLYDPSVQLPSCGCVMHAGYDVPWLNVGLGGGALIVNYPPALVGTPVYFQSVLIPTSTLPGPVLGFTYGPAFPFGCTEEPSLAPVLSDACVLILP